MKARFNLSAVHRGRSTAIGMSLACVLTMACFAVRALPAPATVGPASVGTPDDALRLIDAVRHGRTDVLRAQVTAGTAVDACAPGDGTALIVAAQRADRAMVDTLLALGADANSACAADGDPLIAAAASGDVDIIGRLLVAGARVDTIVPGDETALITAVRNDRLSAVQFLAAHGADPNLGARADDGRWRTPLNQARSDAVARFLRSNGATQDGAHRL